MPLPLLDSKTFEPTGDTLSIQDYFNPTKNPNFTNTYPSSHPASLNKLDVQTYIKIATTITTPETIEELIPFILQQYSPSNISETYRNIMRYVYKALPDSKKWLILNFWASSYSHQGTGADGRERYQMKLCAIFPDGLSYEEFIRGVDHRLITVSRTPSAGAYSMTDAEQETLRLILLDFATLLEAHWTQFAPTALAHRDDHVFNGIASRISGYAANRPIYYPTGERERCPVPWDWASPLTIKTWIEEGTRVTINVRPNGTRLEFKALAAPGDRRMLSRVLNYSTNVLDHLPYIIKGPKEGAAPSYGVELESCSDYTPADLIKAQKDLFFIMKQDGSIRGSKPEKYEIVTVPASLRAHKRLWAELFEKIDYNAFDTTKDTGNGMHVHIGREYFTAEHINRFTWFITNPSNFEFIFSISERPTKTDLSHWAQMPNYGHIRNRHSAAIRAYEVNNGLRGSVHFKGHKTVEVRLFKGIVSYATIIKNLEFVDSVFHFTQTTHLSQLTLSNYIAWLSATEKNRYQTLKAFLSEIKLADMIANAEVSDYLWGIAADHQMADLLNKAPFKVTSAHVTALNKKRRKRAFILKNGKVMCVASNGGLLAKLDKSLSKKQTRGAATFTMNEFAA